MTEPEPQDPELAVAAAVVALLALALLIFPGDDSRTVTAHFDRAVAVYPGTDLRVMGVQIGKVDSVVPDGSSVRVEMTYDAEYKLPADAKAAVVTPTLVADRYVQVFPAYGKGAVLPDDGDIPLERTQTPIELDRMYKALDDLSVTLGPKEGTTGGALDNLLTAGTKALEGNGELGSKTIRNLSEAADTFARNRGPLFDNVRSLAEITDTLAANDKTVEAFLESLTSVSGQLEGEREELRQMLEVPRAGARHREGVRPRQPQGPRQGHRAVEQRAGTRRQGEGQPRSGGPEGLVGPEQPRRRVRVHHGHVRLPGAGRPGHPVPAGPVPLRDAGQRAVAPRAVICPIIDSLLRPSSRRPRTTPSATATDPAAIPTDPEAAPELVPTDPKKLPSLLSTCSGVIADEVASRAA